MTRIKGTLYRILTEDINTQTIINLCSNYFEGFTVRQGGLGYWKGQPEKSITFEIITNKRSEVFKLAKAIKQANNQEAVIVERIDNHAYAV